MADRITGLRLSDDDDTPHQIDFFLSNSFARYEFLQLKSLSLYHLSSIEIIKNVVLQFSRLPLLTYFNLIDCHFVFHQKTLRDIMNRIWHLPKLTNCHLDLHFREKSQFTIPTIRSKSIEYLIIENISLDFIKLIRLFRCTPNLRHLTAYIDELSNNSQFPFVIQSISSSKLVVNQLTNGTINLLKTMPNLTVLTLQTGKHHMNGHKWKEFIINYLSKLKLFRFMMLFHVINEDEMNEILDSYRTPFWLIDHQWFVRCHWNLEHREIFIHLYTLPFAFSHFSYILENSNICTKSTCPDENDYWSYNRVTRLSHPHLIPNELFRSRIRFHNVRHLRVTLPLADQFLSVLPRLDRLISLQSSLIQHLPLYLNSNSILRLDLQSYHYENRDRCFNKEQCTTFLRSSLAKQCEVLQIVVDDRSNINHLINGMDNLRALKVIFQPGQWNNYSPSREESIALISSSFSRTFTDNLIGTETIRLWIR